MTWVLWMTSSFASCSLASNSSEIWHTMLRILSTKTTHYFIKLIQAFIPNLLYYCQLGWLRALLHRQKSLDSNAAFPSNPEVVIAFLAKDLDALVLTCRNKLNCALQPLVLTVTKHLLPRFPQNPMQRYKISSKRKLNFTRIGKYYREPHHPCF